MTLPKHFTFQGNIWRSSYIAIFYSVYNKNLKLYSIKDLILQTKCIKYLLIFRSGGPDVFYKKGVPRNLAKFTGKHLCQSLYFNKFSGLTSLKQRLRHKYFSETFAKFLRTPFLTEHLRWLLLYMAILSVDINFWKTPLRITFKNVRRFQANICGGVLFSQLKLCLCGSQ